MSVSESRERLSEDLFAQASVVKYQNFSSRNNSLKIKTRIFCMIFLSIVSLFDLNQIHLLITSDVGS